METLEGSTNFTHFHVEPTLWDVGVLQGIPSSSSTRVTIIVYLSASSALTHKLPEDMWWSGGGIVPLVVISTTPSATPPSLPGSSRVEFNHQEELAMQSRIHKEKELKFPS